MITIFYILLAGGEYLNIFYRKYVFYFRMQTPKYA